MKGLLVLVLLILMIFPELRAQYCAAGATTDDEYISRVQFESIDERRIWNVCLTQDQIKAIMYQPIEASGSSVVGSVTGETISGLNWTNDLVLYAHLNEGSGVSASDQSPQSNNGTLTNSPSFSSSTAPIPFRSIASGSWDTRIEINHSNERVNVSNLGLSKGVYYIQFNTLKSNMLVQ